MSGEPQERINHQSDAVMSSGLASLRLWIPMSVALFVLLGSLGLLWVFERHRETEERAAFEELARVNAKFLERTRLTRNEIMADRLSEIIGAQVFFYNELDGNVIAPSGQQWNEAMLVVGSDGEVNLMDEEKMVVRRRLDERFMMIFVKDRSVSGLGMVSKDAWIALSVFWVFSLGLGLLLSSRVTRPLQSMMKSLPLVGVERDIPGLPVGRRDEIGALAQTLQQTNESLLDERDLRRAAERHAILGRMAASLAHEIRNPISGIKLHAQLLDVGDASSFEESRRLILSESERMEDLVNQWMSYSKPSPPKKQQVSVAEVLKDSITLIAPQAKHSGVEIDSEVNGAGPLMADPHQLQQVFGNLLRNAIQSMPNGGKVRVRVADSEEYLEVGFADQGGGFSESAMEHLGEAFYTEKEGGMGLGLAVVSDICYGHGGELTAENQSDGGAVVRVRLRKSR